MEGSNGSAPNLETDIKIKIHIWISFIIFLVLFLTRFFLINIPLNYGYGQVTAGSLFLLFYGFYLIFVSALYFRNVFYNWKNNNLLERSMIKSYLLLLFFCMLIALLVFSGQKNDPLDFFNNILENPTEVFEVIPLAFFTIGLSIVFPTSLYTIFLSISSLILSKKENRSNSFGIPLLVLSLVSLIASFISFYYVLIFWIQGGIIL